MVTTTTITQADPVRFRVREYGPNPFPQLASPGRVILSIARIDTPGINFEMLLGQFLPYRDAVDEAIRTQAVYWVDWDYSTTPTFPPRMYDSTLDRLLNAIQDRQLVPPDADQG